MRAVSQDSFRRAFVVASMAAFLTGAAAPAAEPVEPGAPALRVERHSPPEGYPSLGPAGAKNTLVFFTDYQCPVCPRPARELERLVADFMGELRVEVRHHPLAMHAHALDAAAAARAAQRQGRFWPYHEALVEAKRFDRDSLLALAATVGLDKDRFLRDFEDDSLRRQVADEAKQAEEAGAHGTPGFLINGHVEVGWASLPWLEQVIRSHSR